MNLRRIKGWKKKNDGNVIKVDATGLPCPDPLVKLSDNIKNAKESDLMEITATDPGFYKDVQAFASSRGLKIVKLERGTYKGLDTALVEKTTYSMNFFKNFEVKEIIAKPRYRVKELPEYKFKNWKGDLNKYYGWKKEKSE